MEQNIKQQRINVVDSLRGFAVVGIIIIHFLEHLNFYAFPEPTAFDQGLWDTVFYINTLWFDVLFHYLLIFIVHPYPPPNGSSWANAPSAS